MTATFKKHFSRLSSDELLFRAVDVVDRDCGADTVNGTIVEVTRSAITVDVPNGKFDPFTYSFRRETGTQIGGSRRLDLEGLME